MRADREDAKNNRRGSAAGRQTEDFGQEDIAFGQYRWDIRSDVWAWSRGMFSVHGYPGPVIVPTTALLLTHKDESGRSRAVDIVERVGRETSNYANYHRIIDAKGRTRTVLSLGSSVRTDEGGLVATGFMADLTGIERSVGTAAVAAASEGRTAISQAQGAVMAVFGLNADAALAMLIWYAQSQRVKLNGLCRSLLASFARNGPIHQHEQLTNLLLQAGEQSRRADSR